MCRTIGFFCSFLFAYYALALLVPVLFKISGRTSIYGSTEVRFMAIVGRYLIFLLTPRNEVSGGQTDCKNFQNQIYRFLKLKNKFIG